ncbi:MAG: YidC/Oxa1 family membrane protein insertase [Turicibacter sp.]|nr:YidC/Oxa1 family membrane protein insertase [Turicibacter sp.]
MNKKKLLFVLTLIVGIIILTGCAGGAEGGVRQPITTENASGWWETFLVLPLSLVITWASEVIGNLGIAIIVVTVVAKALIMPLSVIAMRNTAKMQELRPEQERIQKKYANKKDRGSQMAMQQEMSMMYKENNVNMMAGCLPMIAQMVLMIGFFQAFSRHPLILGVEGVYFVGLDLAATHGVPNIVFAVVVGGLMFFSQKRQQAAMQASNPGGPNMGMMNIVMAAMFLPMVYVSPLAMGLYFLVSQIMMLIQSLIIKKPGTA